MTVDEQIDNIFGRFVIRTNNYPLNSQQQYALEIIKDDSKQDIKKLLLEARINENEIMQHQAYNILKSAKAVGQWSELRIDQLTKEANSL